MPIVAILLVLLFATITVAQDLSPGKARLKEAMEFQGKIKSGNTSLMEVRDRWEEASRDPVVRKEKDALAIAYASRAGLERDLGNLHIADSLYALAMPLFELKASKAFFLISQANLKKLMGNSTEALLLFQELATDFDSLTQLREIKFYAKSGYPDLAYAIDACRHIALIATSNKNLRPTAITTLRQVARKHANDQLGLMALIGLAKIDEKNRSAYQSTLEKLIEKNGYSELATEFRKHFEERQ